jgi:predicted transcriptional regulator of viral defense system
MQYIEFMESLKDFTIFSLNDIRRVDDRFFRTRLNEWQNKGFIKKVIKGYYIFSDLELNENVFFEIANRIYNPSYISFETALSWHGLIPESVYGITSVSTRRTYKFKTYIAEFTYRKLKPQLFFGYDLVEYRKEKCLKIACVEKAILDYFYINTFIREEDDFASLRINKDVFFEKFNEKRMNNFLETFGQKRLSNRIKSFLEFIKNA